MRQLLPIITILAILVSGCASKHYAKQAKKYDQAGLFRDAAQMYYQSVVANNKNIEAKLGLQRSGQLVLQEKLEQFKTNFDNNATKEAVYSYIDADKYFNMVKGVGVNLIFPSETKVYYDEVKEKYLSGRYAEALQALDVESFASSEAILSEILSIDNAYKDSKTHWITAKYEPVYRQANEQYNNSLYRTAYNNYNVILSGAGTYKDVADRKAQALDKAMITIAVAPFAYNFSFQSSSTQTLRAKLINELGTMKSPFYKVVSDPLISVLPVDGRKSLTAQLVPYLSINAQSFSVRAVLTGHIVKLQEVQGNLTANDRKGYLKRTEEYVDKTTGEKKSRTVYDKVVYQEYLKKNSSLVLFEYSLIDVKTGSILVSDAINLSDEAGVNYVSFQGDTKRLVPGYWKFKDKESSEDAVWDNTDQVNKLKALLDAPRDVKSAQSITADLLTQAAKKAVASIENYNPEK
jgi:hypothetical protein